MSDKVPESNEYQEIPSWAKKPDEISYWKILREITKTTGYITAFIVSIVTSIISNILMNNGLPSWQVVIAIILTLVVSVLSVFFSHYIIMSEDLRKFIIDEYLFKQINSNHNDHSHLTKELSDLAKQFSNELCDFTKNIEYIDKHFQYQRELKEKGIEQVYLRRKKTETEGYYNDLLNEFNELNEEHYFPDKPIKIIGASLDTCFKNTENTDDLPNIIAGLCLSAYFQVMLCTLENNELKTRLDFVNKRCKTEIKLDDTPIISQINTTRRIIKKLQNNNERLKCKQYEFSPYATIIIVNDHIYYTPNVLDYLSYLPINEQDMRNEFEYDAELSLCIRKNSEYGERLVDLFDSLWENGLSKPL